MLTSRNRFFLFLVTIALFTIAGPASAAVLTGIVDEDSDAQHLSSSSDGSVIAYYDANRHNLKLATCLANCDSTEPDWQVVVVDDDGVDGDVGRYVSLQLDSQGRPVLAYYDWENELLKLATCISDCRSETPNWEIVVVDDGGIDEADVGMYASLQLDSQDRPVVAYYDYSYGDLILATCTNSCQTATPAWQIVYADEGYLGSDVGMHASLQLDSQGRPIIAYYDYSYAALKLATCLEDCQGDASSWLTLYIDENGDVGEFASLQLTSDDKPVIAYHDWDNASLKLATCSQGCRDLTNNRWHTLRVDSVDFYGHSSLQLDKNDHPIISYLQTTGDQLKVATCYALCQQAVPDWGMTIVADNMGHSSKTSLSLDDTDTIRIAFYSNSREVLNNAVLKTPPHIASISVLNHTLHQTGETIYFNVNFDLPVYLTGDAALELTLDSGTVFAPYLSGHGTHNLTFTYTVRREDLDEDGIEIKTLVLDDGSQLTDEAFVNSAGLTLRRVEDSSALLVNQSTYTVIPKVGGGGSLSDATPRIVPHGQSASFILTAEAGYEAIVSGSCESTQKATSNSNITIVTTSAIWADCEVSVGFVSRQTIPFAEDEEYHASLALEQINAAAAYERGLSGVGVKVGVIDNGLFMDSVEFNGMNIEGYDFILDSDNFLGTGTHGTPVSGLIAGRRNGFGMQGVAYEADLVMAVGLIEHAYGNAIADSFSFMRDRGVRVINNSWGLESIYIDGSKGFADTDALEALIDKFSFRPAIEAIKDAVADDTVLVFSAGNLSKPDPSVLAGLPYYYPDLPANFIAVAAVDSSGEIADFSNRCGVIAAWCVAAPGDYVVAPKYSAYLNDRLSIQAFNGTSAATPVVTGLTALLLEQFPWMSGTQLVSTVLTTASNGTNEVLSDIIGRGIIDVSKAINGPAAFEFDFRADTHGQDSEFSNAITGSGGLRKSGAGTLTLSGLNDYSGTTKIDAGRLHVSGELRSPTVIEGGVLSGTGRVATLTVDGGIVAPGASAGTLTTGTLALGASALLEFELGNSTEVGAGINDLIKVEGDLTLDGTLRILTPEALSEGVYTLITYTGDLIDNVLTVTTIVPWLSLTVTADAGNVLLHVASAQILDPLPIVITGHRTNSGILRDPVISQNSSLEGGTLVGNIDNKGEIRNVILAKGARVSGGIIGGSITGSASSPAELNNTIIKSGSRLENVIISGDTVLEPGVILGPNVKFDANVAIPGGLDLTGALKKIGHSTGGSLDLVNLQDDIVDPSSSGGFMSIIRSMQLLGDFEPSGTSMDQNPETGELLVVAENFRSIVLPVRVTMANPEDEEGVTMNEDGDIVIVSVNRRVVLHYPALQGVEVFNEFLSDSGLSFELDERANMVIFAGQSNTASEQNDGPYISALSDRFTQYYSARPDAIAVPAPQSLGAGISVREFPGLKNANIFSVVFVGDNGQLLQQDIVPVPADWLLVKDSLVNDYGFEYAYIGQDGIITTKLGDQVIRARSVYDVTTDSAHVPESTGVIFESIADVNDDGIDDYEMRFPNGDRQLILILP